MMQRKGVSLSAYYYSLFDSAREMSYTTKEEIMTYTWRMLVENAGYDEDDEKRWNRVWNILGFYCTINDITPPTPQ